MDKQEQITSVPRITEIYGRTVAEKFLSIKDPDAALWYLNGVTDGLSVYKRWLSSSEYVNY